MPGWNAVAPATQTDEEDDGLYGPERVPNKDMRSKLLRSKERHAGQIINACPFGCKDHELDEQMYCRHLIGWTDPNDKAFYFPMKFRPQFDKDGKAVSPKNTKRYRFTDGEDPQIVEPTDRLVEATICFRVYRGADNVPAIAGGVTNGGS